WWRGREDGTSVGSLLDCLALAAHRCRSGHSTRRGDHSAARRPVVTHAAVPLFLLVIGGQSLSESSRGGSLRKIPAPLIVDSRPRTCPAIRGGCDPDRTRVPAIGSLWYGAPRRVYSA